MIRKQTLNLCFLLFTLLFFPLRNHASEVKNNTVDDLVVKIEAYIGDSNIKRAQIFDILDKKRVYPHYKRFVESLSQKLGHVINEINYGFGVDQYFMYYPKEQWNDLGWHRVLPSIDVDNLTFYTKSIFSDGNFVYGNMKIEHDVDPSSFNVDESGIIKDNNHVYTWDNKIGGSIGPLTIIPTADPATYRRIGDFVAIDKNTVFYENDILDGISPEGIKVNGNIMQTDNGRFLAVFDNEVRKWTAIQIDMNESFEELKPLLIGYYFSKDNLYYNNEMILEGLGGLIPFFNGQYLIVPEKAIFYEGNKIIGKHKIGQYLFIENNYFLVDGEAVFYKSQRLDGVNANYFSIINSFGHDDSHLFCGGELIGSFDKNLIDSVPFNNSAGHYIHNGISTLYYCNAGDGVFKKIEDITTDSNQLSWISRVHIRAPGKIIMNGSVLGGDRQVRGYPNDPYYYSIDNSIFYKDLKIDANPAEFRVLKFGDFAADDSYVYYRSKRIEGINPTNFRTISDYQEYFANNESVYYRDRETETMSEIVGADRDSFVVDNWEYGHDKNGIYYRHIKVNDYGYTMQVE